ncbi:MAG: arylsulfatase, partial [Acidobacteria bacterium]|nr:arylsulfatase [Acidobacteriota bacterium]
LGKKPMKPSHKAVVHQSEGGFLAIRQGNWKLICAPDSGEWKKPETGAKKPDLPAVQLYDLAKDVGETRNLQSEHPDVVKRLTALLGKYIAHGRSTPGQPQKNDITVDLWNPPPKSPGQ